VGTGTRSSRGPGGKPNGSVGGCLSEANAGLLGSSHQCYIHRVKISSTFLGRSRYARHIFRDFGPSWLEANRGHVSHAQLKVMDAILACRTATLGGFVARCENPECAHTLISYCSCPNRHCRKGQGSQALAGMEERKAELLEVPYFHIVFTLPAEIGAIAYQNKAEIYGLLFKAASHTMLTIASDPKHLGAKIAITAVLHTWGSAMTHHPHVHLIVTGGRVSPHAFRSIA